MGPYRATLEKPAVCSRTVSREANQVAAQWEEPSKAAEERRPPPRGLHRISRFVAPAVPIYEMAGSYPLRPSAGCEVLGPHWPEPWANPRRAGRVKQCWNNQGSQRLSQAPRTRIKRPCPCPFGVLPWPDLPMLTRQFPAFGSGVRSLPRREVKRQRNQGLPVADARSLRFLALSPRRPRARTCLALRL
jgi:hypothetical protein